MRNQIEDFLFQFFYFFNLKMSVEKISKHFSEFNSKLKLYAVKYFNNNQKFKLAILMLYNQWIKLQVLRKQYEGSMSTDDL